MSSDVPRSRVYTSWLLAEAGADWVVVDVLAVGEEVGAVADAAVGEASLPDRELRLWRAVARSRP